MSMQDWCFERVNSGGEDDLLLSAYERIHNGIIWRLLFEVLN